MKEALIIDDEVDFCLLMQSYLSKKGFDVNYRNSLKEGLRIIESNRPDIIILDRELSDNMEAIVETKVESIKNYHPEIHWIRANHPYGYEERSISDDLKRIVKWIRDKLNL